MSYVHSSRVTAGNKIKKKKTIKNKGKKKNQPIYTQYIVFATADRGLTEFCIVYI